MAYWNISRSFGCSVANKRISHRTWAKSIDVTEDMAYKISGQPITIIEAIKTDMTVSGKISALLLI
jgi:hypothetical protein